MLRDFVPEQYRYKLVTDDIPSTSTTPTQRSNSDSQSNICRQLDAAIGYVYNTNLNSIVVVCGSLFVASETREYIFK